MKKQNVFPMDHLLQMLVGEMRISFERLQRQLAAQSAKGELGLETTTDSSGFRILFLLFLNFYCLFLLPLITASLLWNELILPVEKIEVKLTTYELDFRQNAAGF